jgi:predicted acyl esterase
MGGPVFYSVPPQPLPTPPNPPESYPDNWGLSTAPSWPPNDTPVTYYLHSGGILNQAVPTTQEAADTMDNGPWLNPVGDMCTNAPYGPLEFEPYTTDVGAGPSAKLTSVEADLYLSSDIARFQVALDAFEVTPGGVERRIWKGTSIVVPTARGVTPNTKVRFQFKPSGNGNNFAMGNKLRIKVATNYHGTAAPEPYVATQSIFHTNTHPSKIILHFAT